MTVPSDDRAGDTADEVARLQDHVTHLERRLAEREVLETVPASVVAALDRVHEARLALTDALDALSDAVDDVLAADRAASVRLDRELP